MRCTYDVFFGRIVSFLLAVVVIAGFGEVEFCFRFFGQSVGYAVYRRETLSPLGGGGLNGRRQVFAGGTMQVAESFRFCQMWSPSSQRLQWPLIVQGACVPVSLPFFFMYGSVVRAVYIRAYTSCSQLSRYTCTPHVVVDVAAVICIESVIDRAISRLLTSPPAAPPVAPWHARTPLLRLSQTYQQLRQHGRFSDVACLNFGVHVYDGGDVLSIVVDAGAHGTHVAGEHGSGTAVFQSSAALFCLPRFCAVFRSSKDVRGWCMHASGVVAGCTYVHTYIPLGVFVEH